MRPTFLSGLVAAAVLTPFAAAQDLEWSTFLGGKNFDAVQAYRGTCVAPNGDVLVWGSTTSPDFPVVGPLQTYRGHGSRTTGDAFLTRLRADGSGIVWSTFLGGTGDERISGLVVDPSGAITICGWTNSTDFPTTAGAFDTTHNGSGSASYGDGFVTRIIWNGRQLQMVWSTLLGGAEDEVARQLAVLPSGDILLGGWTRSTNFPTRGNPVQQTLAGQADFFLARLTGDGRALRAATFLGGKGTEVLADLVLDSAGHPVVAGWTWSADFPTSPGAFQPRNRGQSNGVIARLDADLSKLLYATHLGGQGDSQVSRIQWTPHGEIVAAGYTDSTDFPTTPGAFDTTYNGAGSTGPGDGFAAILDPRKPGAAQLRWSTYLGGTGGEGVNSVAVDRAGQITVAGPVSSTDFPVTTGTYQSIHHGGNWDAYVTRLDPGRSGAAQLVYSTYLGGSSYEYAYSVSVDALGSVVVAGPTGSATFPTTAGAHDTTHNGAEDVFVSKLDLLPVGVTRVGASTPACAGPIYQGVSSGPKAGNADFAVHVTGAAPFTPGVLAFGLGASTPGTPFLNVTLHTAPLVVVPRVTDADGRSRIPLPIAAGIPRGTRVGLQWAFETTRACPGTGMLGTSAALEITVQ